MRKTIFSFVFVTVFATVLGSCGNGTAASSKSDSTAVDSTVVDSDSVSGDSVATVATDSVVK